MRRWTPVAVVAVVGTLAGCTSQSFDPTTVPTEAAAPYLCDGVPTTGLEALTGDDHLEASDDPAGTWGKDFLCEARDGSSTKATVSSLDVTSRGGGSVDDRIAELKSAPGAVVVVGSASGAGYVLPSGDQPHATWVCADGRVTEVRLFSSSDDDRLVEGLSRYLISVLPWGCGDATPPAATA